MVLFHFSNNSCSNVKYLPGFPAGEKKFSFLRTTLQLLIYALAASFSSLKAQGNMVVWTSDAFGGHSISQGYRTTAASSAFYFSKTLTIIVKIMSNTGSCVEQVPLNGWHYFVNWCKRRKAKCSWRKYATLDMHLRVILAFFLATDK